MRGANIVLTLTSRHQQGDLQVQDVSQNSWLACNYDDSAICNFSSYDDSAIVELTSCRPVTLLLLLSSFGFVSSITLFKVEPEIL